MAPAYQKSQSAVFMVPEHLLNACFSDSVMLIQVCWKLIIKSCHYR